MSNIISLSRQRIDICDKIDAIKAKMAKLESDKSILQCGLRALDEGESMVEGKGFLAAEVKSIMQKDI